MYRASQVFEMHNLISLFIKTLAIYINQYVITKKYVELHRPFKNCILQFKSNWLLCNKNEQKWAKWHNGMKFFMTKDFLQDNFGAFWNSEIDHNGFYLIVAWPKNTN